MNQITTQKQTMTRECSLGQNRSNCIPNELWPGILYRLWPSGYAVSCQDIREALKNMQAMRLTCKTMYEISIPEKFRIIASRVSIYKEPITNYTGYPSKERLSRNDSQ